ncbi:vacuolar protein sorting-associated protein 33A [Cimex lectularius]|uniref:Vacuolar protein sorting-associated protein 33A n=1 Tax=Cimex lectularius TaxID=79782 RepID=A0A8I6RLJ0_CIMLE|nr:vacuolar protein sorting-associated protein 33A [Cimex lectularius]
MFTVNSLSSGDRRNSEHTDSCWKMSHLEGGKVSAALLQKHLQKEFLRLLDKCDGEKLIMWDMELSGPMGQIATNKLLKEHNVMKMLKFTPGKLPIPSTTKSVIFIARAEEHLMDIIASNLREEQRCASVSKDFYLFFVPRRTKLCMIRLEEKGVLGTLNVEDLECDIYPFDYDLLSMEVGSAFRDFFLDKDPTYIYQAAEALMTLQSLYGMIPKVLGKGQAAFQLHSLMKRLAQEPRTPPPSVSQIDQLVLIDRSVDLISPLATQLTYEGLIDEIFKINCTTVTLPAEEFDESDDRHNGIMAGTKKVILNSGDEIYSDIRDKSFSAIGPYLDKKTKHITSTFREKISAEKSMDELKEFVTKLPDMKASKRSLEIHLSIAKLIRKYVDSDEFLESLNLEQSLLLGSDTDKVQQHIEDLIARQAPLLKVLRLICLQSGTNSGLKPKVLEYYKREIVQTYGFHHILTLTNLEDSGLLTIQNSRSYSTLRRLLKLTDEDDSETMPNDISYVHSMYAPLSVRLIQVLLKIGSWSGLRDVMMQVPGPFIDSSQPISSSNKRRNSVGSEASSQNDSKKIVLVFFLGGCTFAEISALRFIGQQEENNIEFMVATTKIINGNSFLEELSEPLDPSTY